MRLSDIISSTLLPRFASNAEWEQDALDVYIKAVRALSFGLGAPYTRESVAALTDADLQAFYASYGIAIYYPDLARSTRENMLFELAKMYRFLGTPYAVETLCRYIFNESEAVQINIKDNIAFDDDGVLIDADLLDLFDIEVDLSSPSYTLEINARIMANVYRFCRNTQTLREIVYKFSDDLPVNISMGGGANDWFLVTFRDGIPATLPLFDFITIDSAGKITGGAAYDGILSFSTTYHTIDDDAEVIFVAVEQRTISFINTEHPEFEVPLPATISQDYGPTATLPSVSGTYEDSDYTYTPSAWSIGAFGASITLRNNLVAVLLWDETPIGPVLPTVSKTGAATVGARPISISNGNGFTTPFSYDSTKIYSVSTGDGSGGLTRYGWTCSNVDNYIYATNTTGGAVTVYGYGVYECNSLFASVVAVYDSLNNAFSAFKFTVNNTDYYYVLDGTQTDWTDDLSSIGYHLQLDTLDIWFALSATQGLVEFGENDYWGSYVIDDNDKSLLQNFGVTLTQVTVSGVAHDAVSFNINNSLFSFAPIGLYEGIRTDPRNADMTNFRCDRGPEGSSAYYPQICIWSTNKFTSTCKTWLCRITKNS